ncbi:protein TolB [Hordeum vulgare]|nr:protein TolB [Hordeum vulgare]
MVSFVSDSTTRWAAAFVIYMVRPKGTDQWRVVHITDGGEMNHPWSSPDSKRMMFTSDLAAVSTETISNSHHYQPYGDIFNINMDSSGLQRLTHNSFEDGTPLWTPHYLEPCGAGGTLRTSESYAF